MHARLPPVDELIRLGREEPDALERLRQRLCEVAINRASETVRPQLRALQSRIDMETQRQKTPLARCVRLSAMMHDAFTRLTRVLNDELPSLDDRPKATVIVLDDRRRPGDR